MAALLATLALLALWRFVTDHPYVDTDSVHYQAMADGKIAMKPFAFRVLEPAMARLFAEVTGRPTTDGFLVVGLLSGWVLLYCVLVPILERRQDTWLAFVLIFMPFWLRNFTNYFLPDLLHAALCAVYLSLLKRRWWGWASAMLPLMFLARESTLMIAAIAVPALWWLAGRRAGLLQLGGTLAGMAASKFAARHAFANQHNINDTLYMIGKIPWNASRNLLGITLWTNTLPVLPPSRVWNLPHWLPLGSIHQVGYSEFSWEYLMLTSIWLLNFVRAGEPGRDQSGVANTSSQIVAAPGALSLHRGNLWRGYVSDVADAGGRTIQTLRLRMAVVSGLSAGDDAPHLAQLAGPDGLGSGGTAPDRRLD